jgi:capsular polysaccharide biosynthesis protein
MTGSPLTSLSEKDQRAHPSPESNNNRPGVSMDVLSLMRLLSRHWRVTAPAVLLTVLALVAAFRVSSPTYKATGSIVLINPREAPEVDQVPQQSSAGQNPFTRYGDVAIVTDILARIMNSDSKRSELLSQGVTEYDVVANAFQHDPVFEVTGHGSTSDAAIRSTGVVLEEADSVLEELQHAQGADPDYFINSAPLAPPSTAAVVYSSTMRAAIATLVVGGLCTLALAVLAEVIAKRRALRKVSALGPIGADGAHEVVEAVGSNGSAVDRSVEPELGNEGIGVAGSKEPPAWDLSAPVGDGAAGANGSAGSNGSADVHSVAGVGDSAAGSNGFAVEGTSVSTAAREGDGGHQESFDSAGIVADGSRRGDNAAGSKGSSARGRPPAPLGRRPHRRSLPDKSSGSRADYRDPPPSDR